MRHGSLFSGIGGFDLASEWMGWENVFHCEWNEFGKKVLKHYWPEAISYDDITKTDFTIHRGFIDILTGGFPCQPYSMAGKRKGKEDERHLWPEMLRAIREIQPRWVVGENVLGLVNWNGGMVFDEVQSDLEAQGYEVMPFILPAAGVNAPHKRDRVWFVAYSNDKGRSSRFGEIQEENGEISQRHNYAEFSNTNYGDATNSKRIRLQYTTKGRNLEQSESKTRSERCKFTKSIETNGGNGDASDTDCEMLEHWNGEGKTIRPTIEKKRVESFDGPRKWEEFPSQSPLCGGDDGIPAKLDGITFPKWRNESIKGFGNAIVPQVVYQIFKAIEMYET